MIKEYNVRAEIDNEAEQLLYPNIVSRMQECAYLRNKSPKDLKEAEHNKKLTKLMEEYKNGSISVEMSVMQALTSKQS